MARSIWAVLIGWALVFSSGIARSEVIEFDSDQWKITNGSVEEYLGRKSLAGGGVLQNVEFVNGVIEVDIAADGQRSFPGIQFRAQDPQNTELFYFRPHKPNQPDALQYTPTYKGLSGWQLFHGRGYTAAVNIPHNEWIHLRMEVLGKRARIFFGDQKEPALVINDLRRDVNGGYVGLRAPGGGAVHYANFEIELTEDLDFGPVPKRAPAENMLRNWQISPPRLVREVDRSRVPTASELDEIEWQDVVGDRRGLIDLAPHVTKSGQTPEVVFARTVVRAEQNGIQELSFGYSDAVHLFVNGELLFAGQSAFRSRDLQFQGIVGLNDAVYPRLKKGDNEILLMVSEVFGGWGFMARLEPVRGEAVKLHETVTGKWEVTGELKAPESAAFDKAREVVYVSNYNPFGAPGAKDGFLSRLSTDGEMLDLQWVEGLDRPTGLALRDNRLFVVERGGVAVVDVESGAIAERLSCPNEGMLNDIDVDPSGTIYVSDSRKNNIYRFENGNCEAWLEGWPLVGPNGLLVDGDKLVVGNLRGENLLVIDRRSKTVEADIELGSGMVDGVEADGEGGYIVSQYNGRVLRVQTSGETQVLVDATEAPIYCADLDYVPERGLLVVPSLMGGSLAAYEIATPSTN
jgi:hypothetical protein